MSSYLTFRKNQVVICSFSRNSKIYQAFEGVPYGEWKNVTRGQLRNGLDNLRIEFEEKETKAKVFQQMLKAKMSYEDVYSVANSIIENQQELNDIKRAMNYLELILDIESTDNYDKQSPLEWCID